MLVACPFPAHQGTPGSIREMAEAVAERGHEVHIVTYHFGQGIPVRGPHVHRIPPLTNESAVVIGPTSRKPLYDLQMVFKTLQVIRAHRPALLHAHGYEAALVAWLCRLVTGLPVLYSGHNTMGDELASYDFIRPRWLAVRLARFLDAWVPRSADRCLPHSANLARFFEERGLGRRTEPAIPFGIDLDAVRPGDPAAARLRYGLGDDPVVLYAGLTDEFQRLDLLLDAMVLVVRHEPRAKLLVVVSIPHEGQLEALRRRSADLGIAGHLVITDPLPFDDVQEVLAAADVAVAPRPSTAGFAIKLLNYMAARRPCVLFASSGDPDLIDGEHARVVAPDTALALGQAIAALLGDPALRARLADGGYRFVRARHDRRETARRLCAAYQRTLAAARRPSRR
jgi:glycosyltransferase involved in cell wall biosynthesis